jgi:hypothetical protein
VESFIKDVELKLYLRLKMQMDNGHFGPRLIKTTKDSVLLTGVENTHVQQVRHAEVQLNLRFLYLMMMSQMKDLSCMESLITITSSLE